MTFWMQPQHSESRRCGKLGSDFKSSIKENNGYQRVCCHIAHAEYHGRQGHVSTQQSALRKRAFQPCCAFAGGVNTPWNIEDEILPIDNQQILEFDSTYCTVSGLRLPALKRLQAQ